MAGRKGLGVLGFSVGALDQVPPLRDAYKKAIKNAEPVGAFVNDNLMVCIAAYVAEDTDKARNSMVNARPNYLVSNVFRYHDTFPHPAEIPNWPNLIPDIKLEEVDYYLETGGVCGNPDEALEQVKRWEDTGIDQLVFGIGPAPVADTIEMIELMGKHVIPKIDPDPVHSTTKYREAAAKKG
jgi:alkanesulfonate monooxygenase SsuD/methylene tetrahydromethanopterin reductase-like flavin-dependent oxidoreductase (luciferase family)